MTRDELLEVCRQKRAQARKAQKAATQSVSALNAARLQGEAKGRAEAFLEVIVDLEQLDG